MLEGGRGFTLKGQVDALFVLGRFGMLFKTYDHFITIRQRLGRSEQIVIVQDTHFYKGNKPAAQ